MSGRCHGWRGGCGARGKSSCRIGDSARTSRLHNVPFWDALIIEAAQASGASELLSEVWVL